MMAIVQLSVVEKRMMNSTEAAGYCGLPVNRFKTACPAPMVSLGGRLVYDKRDLDQWIDTEKSGRAAMTNESILARL
jgi:hypothetical protein